LSEKNTISRVPVGVRSNYCTWYLLVTSLDQNDLLTDFVLGVLNSVLGYKTLLPAVA